MGTSLPIQIRWILCGCGCFYSLIPSLLTISFEPLFLWLPPSLQSLSSYIIVVWKIFFQSQLLSAFGCCPIVNVVQYKIFCIILSMYMHTSYCFWLTAFLSLIPCVKDQCTCSYSLSWTNTTLSGICFSSQFRHWTGRTDVPVAFKCKKVDLYHFFLWGDSSLDSFYPGLGDAGPPSTHHLVCW